MLRHGLSQDSMLHGTMVPIRKGRWANVSSSDNFRVITLSSILFKLLDVIVMTKEKDNLCTSNIQFSFKLVLPPHLVQVWCKRLYHIMLIMSQMCVVYCLMLAKLLIIFTTVTYSGL